MSRRLGQHFLHDPSILDRIVDALDPQPSDVVVEIGPGRGSLTLRLAPRVGRLVSIEKDATLVRRLQDDPAFAAVHVLAGDALTVDWHDACGAASFKIAGNVPYYISTPLIHRALSYDRVPVIVFLVQREVADRIIAQPGSKTYGGLSVGVQTYAEVARLFTVAPGAFVPPPKVSSAVVRLTPREAPLLPRADRESFRRFVTAVFGQRRWGRTPNSCRTLCTGPD